MAQRRKHPVQAAIPGTLDAVLEGARALAPAPAPRAATGRRAQRRGEDLETWTRAQLAAATLAEVIVWWTKIEAGVRKVRTRDERGGWRWSLEWGARAHADFVACTATGHLVAIECKSVEGGRLPRTAIAVQQLDHLDKVAHAGGFAFLVVEFRQTGRATERARRYVVPWVYVPWSKARTALSIAEADVARWVVKAGEVLERLRGR